MIPCKLGMRCPYLCYGEIDELYCTYPYIPNAATREEFESTAREEYQCPLIESKSSMDTLMRMCDEYGDESEWRELMRRMSVHLDRPYQEGARWHRIREKAASTAWREYWENSLKEVDDWLRF